jgi:hypothetical protein
MAQPVFKHPPELDGPGSRSFTSGLVAAFRTQVRAVVRATHDKGIAVVGVDQSGRRVVLPPQNEDTSSKQERVCEAG